jgi:hypothetical protein
MAYDFLYDEHGNIRCCEMSYTYDDIAVRNCPGYWDKDLRWYEGHYWPQFCHIQDMLMLPRLKQPDME